ncbi:MAG TPA: hypothetical protein VGV60_05885 [Candidatus Polarisedimenticolia bacterium]|nr:hypothetical protein [Candidatus Polarisedimenticolia bacterium]
MLESLPLEGRSVDVRFRFVAVGMLLSCLASFVPPLAARGGTACAMARCGRSCCCAPGKDVDRCRLGRPCGAGASSEIPMAPLGSGRPALLPRPEASQPLIAERPVHVEDWRPAAGPSLDPPFHPPRPRS